MAFMGTVSDPRSRGAVKQLVVGTAFGLASGTFERNGKYEASRAIAVSFCLVQTLEHLEMVYLPWMHGAIWCRGGDDVLAVAWCFVRRQAWVFGGFALGHFIVIGELI